MSVTVKVLDIDDTAPYFLNSEEWSFDVDEFNALSEAEFIPGDQKLIQRIQVQDSDVDVSNEFYFSIKGYGVAEGLIDFTEDPDHKPEGVLQVVKLIDRESAEIQAVNGSLIYEVTVEDAIGNSNSIEVHVFSLSLVI